MLNFLAIQTFLQITTDKWATLVFDYQSPIAGKIMLQDCHNDIVQAEIVYPARDQSHYKHVHWELPTYCNSYTVLMDSQLSQSLKVYNGWVYEYQENIDPDLYSQSGASYLSFSNGQWFTFKLEDIGKTFYQDSHRLKFHFSAITGWINDPNGLVYHDGLYHMFYQFNPYASHWGNMHWGHAVSSDLMFWHHLPIAFYPNPELNAQIIGGIFTGSAVFHNGTFLIAYTEHLEDKEKFSIIYIEKQKIVLSKNLLTFDPPKTAVYKQPYGATKNFRDPKVWYDSTIGRYCMLIGSKIDGFPSVLLYVSGNGQSWIYEGVLYQEKSIPSVTIECPDLFPLGNRHVLTFNTYTNDKNENHQLFYVVGDFDGQNFTTSNTPRRLDFGNYFYALQIYNNAPDNQTIGIGWMNSWDDLQDYKDQNNFAGAMALPRHLHLLSNSTVGMTPVMTYQTYRVSASPSFSQSGFQTGLKDISNHIHTLEMEILHYNPQHAWTLVIHATRESTNNGVFIQWIPSKRQIVLMNRLNVNATFTSEPIPPGTLNIQIILDVSSIEVFINGGYATGTMRFVPPNDSTGLIYLVSNADSNDLRINTWELQSIWTGIPIVLPSSTPSTPTPKPKPKPMPLHNTSLKLFTSENGFFWIFCLVLGNLIVTKVAT